MSKEEEEEEEGGGCWMSKEEEEEGGEVVVGTYTCEEIYTCGEEHTHAIEGRKEGVRGGVKEGVV